MAVTGGCPWPCCEKYTSVEYTCEKYTFEKHTCEKYTCEKYTFEKYTRLPLGNSHQGYPWANWTTFGLTAVLVHSGWWLSPIRPPINLHPPWNYSFVKSQRWNLCPGRITRVTYSLWGHTGCWALVVWGCFLGEIIGEKVGWWRPRKTSCAPSFVMIRHTLQYKSSCAPLMWGGNICRLYFVDRQLYDETKHSSLFSHFGVHTGPNFLSGCSE